ncbi:MAG TPA: DUF1254 domain-containing protein [Solirubrobacteraceae bacterium]|nr:DUF1254 domain-containing protein [Solirubrobacteraceae bacterium]
MTSRRLVAVIATAATLAGGGGVAVGANSAAAGPGAGLGARSAAAGPGAALTPAQAAALGQSAYLYGFPLVEFLRVTRTETSVRCADRAGDAPVNTFSNARGFARPRDRVIVAPNVDTLYSIAHLDLGRGPVVLSHPAMGRRYFVFELLDPYTNVIAYVGSRTTGQAAGRFAIAWSGHPGRRRAGVRVIRSAYRRVWIIGRTLAGGAADQRRAQALMAQYALAAPGHRRGAASCRPGPVTRPATPTGAAFLAALDRGLAENPPPARDRPLVRQLAAIGVGPGLSVAAAGLTPAAHSALIAAVRQTGALLPAIARNTVLSEAKANHGWANPAPDIGAYGTDYRFRAGVASIGLGANTRAEAVYPTALTDSSGQLLDGRRSYRLVFAAGQAPPAHAFWSLTMYDAAGYLVANPIHRYALGSSHPPLLREPNGSIVVVMQRARPADPRANWLPTPAGPFRLNLRIYWPRASVLSGRWQPPPLTPVR